MTDHDCGGGYSLPPEGVNKLREYDPHRGAHLWIAPAAYEVSDPAGLFMTGGRVKLSHENLLYVQMVACFYCERSFDPRVAQRRCVGEPS